MWCVLMAPRPLFSLCRLVAALVLVAGLMMPITTPLAQSGGNPGVIPPNARPYGLTYGEWSAKGNQWGLALPVE